MSRRISLAIVALTLLLGAPACSHSGGGSASCPSPVEASQVQVADFDFTPRCVGAKAGATLTLQNTGNAPHTYTVGGTSINVKLNPGQIQTAGLSGIAPGTYAAVCEYHPQMRGALRVS